MCKLHFQMVFQKWKFLFSALKIHSFSVLLITCASTVEQSVMTFSSIWVAMDSQISQVPWLYGEIQGGLIYLH